MKLLTTGTEAPIVLSAAVYRPRKPRIGGLVCGRWQDWTPEAFLAVCEMRNALLLLAKSGDWNYGAADDELKEMDLKIKRYSRERCERKESTYDGRIPKGSDDWNWDWFPF